MYSYGLFGEKLGHSMSPKIFKIIFEEYNIDGCYSLLEIKKSDIFNSVKAAKILGFSGVNVTIPYKQDVMSQLDFIDDRAKKIGAVNTIKFCEEGNLGYNTDYFGFGDMINKGDVEIKGNSFFVMGDGGASKGVVQFLKDNTPKEVVVVSRNPKEVIRAISYEELKQIKEGYCLINTTPLGMYPNINTCPIDSAVLSKFQVAMDIVYNPLETEFLKLGRKLGLKTVNGLYMLVGQALKSFEFWSGNEIDQYIFEKIYNRVEKELIEG